MAVNTLSHFSIILKLLEVMVEMGRIVFLSSDTHWPGKSGFAVFPPVIPNDLGKLVLYESDKEGDEAGKEYLRYGLSKLVGIMLMYELNRRLQVVSFDLNFKYSGRSNNSARHYTLVVVA